MIRYYMLDKKYYFCCVTRENCPAILIKIGTPRNQAAKAHTGFFSDADQKNGSIYWLNLVFDGNKLNLIMTRKAPGILP